MKNDTLLITRLYLSSKQQRRIQDLELEGWHYKKLGLRPRF